jgi:hypothetical protein
MISHTDACSSVRAPDTVAASEDPLLEMIGTVWIVLSAAERLPDTPQEKRRIAQAKQRLHERLKAEGRTLAQLEAHLNRRAEMPARQLRHSSGRRHLRRIDGAGSS